MSTDLHDWDVIASNYAREIEAHGDRCFPEVRDRLWQIAGDLRHRNVLDVGCGQGWLTNELATRGAHVIGVDGSSNLVARARSLYPLIRFELADLTAGIPPLDTTFDLIIAHMVIMDLPAIEPLFQDISKILNARGSFIFTLPHPCFFMQKSHQDETRRWFKKLTGYLAPETRRIDSFGGHNHYHRPLGHYTRALNDAGLLVSDLFEPPHQPRSSQIPSEFLQRFPVFLLVAARKAS